MDNLPTTQNLMAIAYLATKTARDIKAEFGFNAEVLIINLDNKKEVAEAEIKDIIHKCCAIWQVNEDDIYKKTRERDIVAMRSIIHHLLKTTTKNSLKTIGELTGGFDHTSVIHSIENVKCFTANNDSLINKYFLPIKHLYNEH